MVYSNKIIIHDCEYCHDSPTCVDLSSVLF